MLEPSVPTTLVQQPADDPTTNKPAENFVTCIHKAKLVDIVCNITVTWAKTVIGHSLYITVENPQDDNYYTCKIDLKTWQFWGKKGLKTFRVAEKRIDVFWDLRSAKFTDSPEPDSDYYVAMVSREELILLLGDQQKEALRRTKSRLPSEDASLVQKKEIVFAKKCFCTKTTLGQDKEHSIIIESSLSGPYDPEMWISVDGMESIRVPNLHWRFRGNETILVDNSPVQILWDVHDWLYNGNHSGVGIFVFRRDADEGEFHSSNIEAEDFGKSFWDVLEEQPSSVGFCHFLYAWKTE
ncbi:uncharacterized protein LOC105176569 [Sesamum indicum]|uniref:Uncharacterized protein LOC105176569 n=1 Tax=Sesamum indicum TaxID=4182 RepID=A0A6I9USF8_SESIN|nr:uncharacterized protein LOC105176569 [Sesamum indicum]